MDVVCSVSLILILLPLLIVIAGLVKMSSPGPVLFRQVRIGQMMKPFMICKFRTMYTNAGHGIHHDYVKWFITSSDKETCDKQAKDKIFKLTSDPRITPIGHFLRKTSLDELPQLWNVLVGEMSLVGPRPITRGELDTHYGGWQEEVLSIRPGLTGLWQTMGRSRLTYAQRRRLDLFLVRRAGPRMFVYVLLRTLPLAASGDGAY